MSSRDIASQKIHDNMVRHLFNELCAKGYETVSACHLELAEDKIPKVVYCEKAKMTFCPDLYAEKDRVPYFFEVETEDSIEWHLTKIEFECFALHAKKCGGYFYVVVPHVIKDRTKSILDEIDEKNWRKTYILTI